MGTRILCYPHEISFEIPVPVLARVPNFHRLSERQGVEFKQVKASEYKRTITMFGKNTDQERRKFQRELEGTYRLFKDFVAEQRPAVDIDAVSTGEHWYGTRRMQSDPLVFKGFQQSQEVVWESHVGRRRRLAI